MAATLAGGAAASAGLRTIEKALDPGRPKGGPEIPDVETRRRENERRLTKERSGDGRLAALFKSNRLG